MPIIIISPEASRWRSHTQFNENIIENWIKEERPSHSLVARQKLPRKPVERTTENSLDREEPNNLTILKIFSFFLYFFFLLTTPSRARFPVTAKQQQQQSSRSLKMFGRPGSNRDRHAQEHKIPIESRALADSQNELYAPWAVTPKQNRRENFLFDESFGNQWSKQKRKKKHWEPKMSQRRWNVILLRYSTRTAGVFLRASFASSQRHTNNGQVAVGSSFEL